MEWLADIISKLPLDSISDTVSEITLWWSNLVADVPPDMLPMYAYVGFSCIVLILWLFIVRILPKPIGGMSWLAVFSVLLTPGVTSGETGDIAPASIGVVYGMLMKEPGLALSNLLPILVVFTLGLVLGFIWQIIRNIITSSIEKSAARNDTDEQVTVSLSASAASSAKPQEPLDKPNQSLTSTADRSNTSKDGLNPKSRVTTIKDRNEDDISTRKFNERQKVAPVIEVQDPFVKKAARNYEKIVKSDSTDTNK